jgi:hypothetical protein
MTSPGASKTCSTCKLPKPLSDFHARRRSRDGRQANCIGCNTKQAQANEWRKLGLDMDETKYADMFAKQGGKCAICDLPNPGAKRLAVDHVHGSTTIRKLLCQNCNTAIGKLGDAPDVIRKAAQYVEDHRVPDSVPGQQGHAAGRPQAAGG